MPTGSLPVGAGELMNHKGIGEWPCRCCPPPPSHDTLVPHPLFSFPAPVCVALCMVHPGTRVLCHNATDGSSGRLLGKCV